MTGHVQYNTSRQVRCLLTMQKILIKLDDVKNMTFSALAVQLEFRHNKTF